MKYLIVGLGNIGTEYQDTRHNIGFNVLDAFARASNIFFAENRYGATCEYKIKGRTLILLKPSTFMNLSGNALRYWMQKENIPIEQVLVVVDDLALPFGALRLKPKGSDAGHNAIQQQVRSPKIENRSPHRQMALGSPPVQNQNLSSRSLQKRESNCKRDPG